MKPNKLHLKQGVNGRCIFFFYQPLESIGKANLVSLVLGEEFFPKCNMWGKYQYLGRICDSFRKFWSMLSLHFTHQGMLSSCPFWETLTNSSAMTEELKEAGAREVGCLNTISVNAKSGVYII